MAVPAYRDQRSKKVLIGRIAAILDELRPLIRADGGDVLLEDIDADGTVHVRLMGACVGCPSSSRTLTLGIERSLRNEIPEVRRVVCEPQV